MSNIQDKVVIITGASSGIGEAAAKELASKGAKLVLAARREDRLQNLQEEVEQSGGTAIYKVTRREEHPCDPRSLLGFALPVSGWKKKKGGTIPCITLFHLL
ncbi:SDR family NAD(P)-dependent oxidoreductase [Paenibacillus sp. 28ISP30-2]|nr:SDR family NAD(P)-dependent oxidoreductase [Paenibacillus sp. 28ISP30-2]